MIRSTATLMICFLLIASMWWLSYGQTTGQIESPRQTTIFLTDPTETEQMQDSVADTYYDTDTVVFPLDEATQKVKNLTDGLEGIERQIKQLDAQYGITNKEYTKTRQDVILIMSNIKTTKESLSNSLKKIIYFQGSILKSADQIAEIRADLDKTIDYMQQFSAFVYKVSKEYYTEDGSKIDDVSLFIKSGPHEKVSEQLANTAMVENVMGSMDVLIDKLQTQEKDTIAQIKASNKSRMRLQDIIKEYNIRLTNLEEQKNFLSNYLKYFSRNGDTQWISLEFPWLFDTKVELLASIKNIVAQIDKKSYDTVSFDVPKKLEELTNTEAFATRDEKAAALSWPTYPIVKLDRYFGDTDDKGETSPGIEIPVPQGTPVFAMDESLVYDIVSNQIGVSRIIMIDKAWHIIVYLYLNEIIVKPWDIVRRGQFIGYSGGEPGTKGAGFAAWWPNLTLLIIKDAAFTDPLAFLDPSVIQDRSNMPSSYQFDYLEAKYSLPREGYKVKTFSGSSVSERRENFLNAYGAGAYRQVELWEKASEWTNIDIDMGICIAFAESTIGNHLSTANNIGNVGNNDRGDRVSYAAPLIGARLIYTTLNNGYLGDYNIILDYNGYGNPDGKNYATSKYNWQNNVTKCLTQIKWYYIPDDYPVRVGIKPTPTL